MKKKLKKIVVLILCACMVQNVPAGIEGGAVTAQAASASIKNGLKKEGKYYYYYKNNKKVTNTWKTIKTKNSNGKTVSYKYYFGKNGRAYMAPNQKSSMGWTKNVVCKKIGKYSYGFDRLGHMVKSGYFNDPDKYDSNGDTLTYYFDKNGRYNAAKTKAIRKAGAYGVSAGTIRKILGTPKKTTKENSCFGEPGDDYKLAYANVYVTIHRYPSGDETVFGIFPM